MGDRINDENPDDGGVHEFNCGIKPPTVEHLITFIIVAHYGIIAVPNRFSMCRGFSSFEAFSIVKHPPVLWLYHAMCLGSPSRSACREGFHHEFFNPGDLGQRSKTFDIEVL